MTANLYTRPSKLTSAHTFNAFASGPISPPPEGGSPKLPSAAWAEIHPDLSMNMDSSPHSGHSPHLAELNTQDPYLSVSSDPEELEFQAHAIRLTPVGGSPNPGSSPHDGNDLPGPGPAIQTQFWQPQGNEYTTTSAYTSPSNTSGFLVPSEIDLSNGTHWPNEGTATFGTGAAAPPQQWASVDVNASQWLEPEQTMPSPASLQNHVHTPQHASMQGPQPGANTNYEPSRLTVSTEQVPADDLGSASTTRGRSPIVMVESVSRGDSPDRPTGMSRRLSRSSNHLSPGGMQDYSSESEEGELDDDHRSVSSLSVARTSNGKWIRNPATGQGGVDPSSRSNEYVISPNELKGQREREQKNEEIGAWLSTASSEVGIEVPPKRTHKPSSRVRARSTGDRPLQQEDYFNIHLHANHVPGPGVLVHESEGTDEDDDASVEWEDTGSDTSPADANDPARYDRSTPDIYPSLERANSHDTTNLFPWNDIPRDSTPRMEAMQPGSSTAAMAAFERRARDIETASLAATIDNNSIINVRQTFDAMSISDEPKSKEKRGSLFTRSFLQASQRIKRQASDLSISTSNTGNPPPPAKSPVSKDSFHRRRISLTPRQHSRSPSLSSALLSMSGQIAAIGGNNAVHAVSPNAEANSRGSFSKETKARGRSRSELPRPVTPGLADLMTTHGGPPVASIYQSPILQVDTKPPKQKVPEPDTAGADDDDDDHMDTADGGALVMEFPPVSSLPLPTLEGFKGQIMQLNPRLEPALINRFANEQIRRYKKLVDLQQKHATAISNGKCKAGQFCFALGGKETLLDQRKTSASSESGQTQFRVSDFNNGIDQPFVNAEGTLPAAHAAQFPAGVPLPPVSRLPAQFECTICFEAKKFQKPSDWSKHVQEDIQPFTCSFPQCNEPKSFKRKADWVRHENELHRQLEWWQCSYDDCNHKCYRKDNFVQHLVREHKLPDPKVKKSKGGAGDHQSEVQRDQELVRLARLLEDCRHETERTADSEPCRFCGNICGSWKKLTVHLGKHMEQLAMPVLELAKQNTASPSQAPAGVAGGAAEAGPSLSAQFQGHHDASGVTPFSQPQYSANNTSAPVNAGMSYETPMAGYSISGTVFSSEPESMEPFSQADQFPGYGLAQYDQNSLHPHIQTHQPIHQNSVTYPPPYNSVHRSRSSETNVPLMQPSYSQLPPQASTLYPAQASYPAYQTPVAPDSSYSSAHYNSSYSSQM